MLKKNFAKNNKRSLRNRFKLKKVAVDDANRISVFISNKYMYLQLIDDENSITLASASTREKDFAGAGTCNMEAASKLGSVFAKRALEKGVKKVYFDRGGRAYHGKVKAIADAARKEGLVF